VSDDLLLVLLAIALGVLVIRSMLQSHGLPGAGLPYHRVSLSRGKVAHDVPASSSDDESESPDAAGESRAKHAARPGVESHDALAVVVTDIRMHFWSMVVLMVKGAIAAIPALIILILTAAAVVALLGGLVGKVLDLL
jgi:hypothetical protein